MKNIDGENFPGLVVIPGVGLWTANLPIPGHFAIGNGRYCQSWHSSSSSCHPKSAVYLERPAADDPNMNRDFLL